MMQFTLVLGILMFVHFGCAVLKHNSKESDFLLKTSLLLKTVLSVLIIRSSLIENESDLLAAFIMNASVNITLSLYAWSHGITFLDIGRHMHKIKASELVASIKKTL